MKLGWINVVVGREFLCFVLERLRDWTLHFRPLVVTRSAQRAAVITDARSCYGYASSHADWGQLAFAITRVVASCARNGPEQIKRFIQFAISPVFVWTGWIRN
jgi:hypothetical protein